MLRSASTSSCFFWGSGQDQTLSFSIAEATNEVAEKGGVTWPIISAPSAFWRSPCEMETEAGHHFLGSAGAATAPWPFVPLASLVHSGGHRDLLSVSRNLGKFEDHVSV